MREMRESRMILDVSFGDLEGQSRTGMGRPQVQKRQA